MTRKTSFPLLSILLAGAAAFAGGCGGSTRVSSDRDAAGPDGSPDSPGLADVHNEAGSCGLDPTGMFVFHLHNGGSRMLGLAFGCGSLVPIVLDTAGGALPIGPAAADLWIHLRRDSMRAPSMGAPALTAEPATGK